MEPSSSELDGGYMSTRLKIRVATFVLLVALTSSVASAVPRRESAPDSALSKIQQIVKQIRKILLPTTLDDPTFPKP
jgi:hypothetical protein